MGYSKISIVLCLTVCLSVLFAPFVLEISQDGKAYAFSSKDNNKSSNLGSSSPSAQGYTIINDDEPPVHPVPEPATLLLFGAGAAGLVAFKKFRKK